MKLSYECKDIIVELLEDIDDFGLDMPCVIFGPQDKWYYTDYLLKAECKLSDFLQDDKMLEMSLFDALVLFIQQNSVLEKPDRAARLLAARNVANMTQSQVAQKLGINPKNYAKWETGERTPKVDNLVKLAEALNIDIKKLI